MDHDDENEGNDTTEAPATPTFVGGDYEVEIIDVNDLPSSGGGQRLSVETTRTMAAIRTAIPTLAELPPSKAVKVQVDVRVAHAEEKNARSKVSRLVRTALENLEVEDDYAATARYEVIEKDGQHVIDGFAAFVYRQA